MKTKEEYIIVKNGHNSKAVLLMRTAVYNNDGTPVTINKFKKIKVRIMTREFFNRTFPEEV